jgi:glutathione S-transferase
MRVILYSFRRCPWAMRARLALRYAGCEVHIREVAIKNKPAELLALSPKGTVPVLDTGEGVLEESLDIMRWALERNDPQQWLSPPSGTLEDMLALIARCDGGRLTLQPQDRLTDLLPATTASSRRRSTCTNMPSDTPSTHANITVSRPRPGWRSLNTC